MFLQVFIFSIIYLHEFSYIFLAGILTWWHWQVTVNIRSIDGSIQVFRLKHTRQFYTNEFILISVVLHISSESTHTYHKVCYKFFIWQIKSTLWNITSWINFSNKRHVYFPFSVLFIQILPKIIILMSDNKQQFSKYKILTNKHLNVTSIKIIIFRKFFTACFGILTERYIRVH